MAFGTYPIPPEQPTLNDAVERIAAQHAQLMPVITKLFQATTAAVRGQQSALNRVTGKLTRAVNGAVSRQGNLVQPIVNSLYGAVDGAIAADGANLAVQNSILSRLAPAGEVPQSPVIGQTSNPFSFRPPAGAGASTSAATSQAAPTTGVALPPFSLAPQEVVPLPTAPPSLSPAAMNGGEWMILVDCDQRIPVAAVRNDPGWIPKIQAGHFVPIRYNVPQVNTIAFDWTGRYAPNAVARACHAFANQGDGWPSGGDFQETGQEEAIIGIPVGDWPFDASGNYTGS